MDLILAGAGLLLLVFAGDVLVRGAVALALKLGISALVVSLTVVAFGTSAPELLIAIEAALADADGIAFGNVVGSNIANVLLVIGLPALIATIRTKECHIGRNYALMIGASVLFIALCFLGPLTYWHGVLMLVVLCLILFDAYRKARLSGEGDSIDELDDADPDMPVWKIALFLVLGLIGLPLGANLLIDGARGVAVAFGVSDAVIGLTLVAIGTSLPELATTVMATIRGKADVVLGNVVGSNLFNLLAIMGVASFFGPLDVPLEFLTFDLWVMLAASLILIPFVLHWTNVTRLWGIGFVALYAGYVWLLV
ncbi:cation:H+ antiporter [Rubricella aquisinus]|uniref:Cation:H+ antiporter n=1 Tax=Rubricella aquisinus TaxID=2028108 RepID=A0A840X537_9RHOB|nr:calcium/sodium antiporter [Rubricella aquisinus]MBB5516906.1 cation:H+ antiporter [Rubricella aquisinus]